MNETATFILLMDDQAPVKEKKFTINLVELDRQGKVKRDIGSRYTFMSEQLGESRIGEKDLLIYQSEGA